MSNRREIYLACLVPLLLTLAACIKNTSFSTTASQPRVLRWATATLPENRDWTECTNERCMRHAALTMEGLTRFDFQSPYPRTVPALAADLRQLNEHEWVVDLRRGIRWNDGKELHPRDFIDSWKRVLSRCRKIPSARLLFPIVGAEAFCRRQASFAHVGLDIRSPTQFVIRLSRATPHIARAFAHPVTWPRRGDAPKDSALTLGAYYADRANPLTYHANPSYYGAAPGTGSIVFLNAPSVEERIGLYREHSADVVEDLDDTTALRLGTDPDLLWVGTGPRIYLLMESVRPIQSLSTRKALASAIDREEIARLLKLPLLPIYSLNREMILETDSPNAPGTSRIITEKSETRAILTWEKGSHLESVAAALKAQWAKTCGFVVDTRAGRTGQLRLVSWTESWFEPEWPPFVHKKQWPERDAHIFPLFERAKALLKSPRLKVLNPYPVGGWNFASLQWG